MPALNATGASNNFIPALKRLYPNGIEEPLFKREPVIAIMPKREDFGGELRTVAIRYTGTGGGSSNFTDAQRTKNPASRVKFHVTRKKEYQLVSLENEVIDASMGDKNAIAEALGEETDAAQYSFTRAVARLVYGNGVGALGQITTISTNTFKFVTADDIVTVEPGMTLAFSVDNTGSAGVRSGELTVSAVDVDSNLVTCTANITVGIPSAANNDYAYRPGDYNNVAAGFLGWNPTTAPVAGGGDSWYGVDRGVHPTRLAGLRYVATGTPIREALINGMARGHKHGAEFSHALMHSIDWGNLVKAVESHRIVDVKTDVPTVGFKAVELEGATGTVKVLGSPNCPRGRSFLTDISSWVCDSLKGMPRFLTKDGSKGIDEASADAREFRLGAYFNFYTKRPRDNMNITL